MPASSTSLDQRIRNHIATFPPSISGNCGYAQTSQVAYALVHGWGLTVDEALPHLVDYNTTSCTPPWTAADLKQHLDATDSIQGRQVRGSLRNASV